MKQNWKDLGGKFLKFNTPYRWIIDQLLAVNLPSYFLELLFEFKFVEKFNIVDSLFLEFVSLVSGSARLNTIPSLIFLRAIWVMKAEQLEDFWVGQGREFTRNLTLLSSLSLLVNHFCGKILSKKETCSYIWLVNKLLITTNWKR